MGLRRVCLNLFKVVYQWFCESQFSTYKKSAAAQCSKLHLYTLFIKEYLTL